MRSLMDLLRFVMYTKAVVDANLMNDRYHKVLINQTSYELGVCVCVCMFDDDKYLQKEWAESERLILEYLMSVELGFLNF